MFQQFHEENPDRRQLPQQAWGFPPGFGPALSDPGTGSPSPFHQFGGVGNLGQPSQDLLPNLQQQPISHPKTSFSELNGTNVEGVHNYLPQFRGSEYGYKMQNGDSMPQLSIVTQGNSSDTSNTQIQAEGDYIQREQPSGFMPILQPQQLTEGKRNDQNEKNCLESTNSGMDRLTVGNGRPLPVLYPNQCPANMEYRTGQIYAINEQIYEFICVDSKRFKEPIPVMQTIKTNSIGTQTEASFVHSLVHPIPFPVRNDGAYQIWFFPGAAESQAFGPHANNTLIEEQRFAGQNPGENVDWLPINYFGLPQTWPTATDTNEGHGTQVMFTGQVERGLRTLEDRLKTSNGDSASPASVPSGKSTKTDAESEQEKTRSMLYSALGLDNPPMTSKPKAPIGWSHQYTSSVRKPRTYGTPPKSTDATPGRKLVWKGQLMSMTEINELTPYYSEKIFIGGIPHKVSREDLIRGFERFGVVDVVWCTREGGDTVINGCAYIILQNKTLVNLLIRSCKVRAALEYGEEVRSLIYEFHVHGREVTVELKPWNILQNIYVNEALPPCTDLEEKSHSVFVGNLHGRLTAKHVASIFVSKGFEDVKSVKIGTSKHEYPAGYAKVTFGSFASFQKAIRGRRLVLNSPGFKRHLQLEPFIDGNTCSKCGNENASVFCKHNACCQYFCLRCYTLHNISRDEYKHNDCVMREIHVKKR